MKIISYNVNGIRAALKKDFTLWLAQENPDVVCLQETKAMKEQVDMTAIEALGYKHYWFSAQKKGYSGVAILAKQEPKHVEYGSGIEHMDFEGRIIRIDFEQCSVMSVYIPSGTNVDRIDYKMKFCRDFLNYIDELRKEIPKIVVCGDYNICHEAIDIHNPKTNKNSSGFLPMEREWLSEFMASGFIDSFRHFVKEAHHYSWWSYRANARNNNKGWRIDYNMVSQDLSSNLSGAYILPEARHSDHCPIVVELDF